MAKRTPQKPAKPRKKPSKALRDSVIVAQAVAGKSNSAIARELGIDRETVAKVLSSDDIKLLAAKIDGALSAGIEHAIHTVLRDVRTEAKVAIELLRNFGSMRQSMKFEHTGKDGERLGSLTDEQIDARLRALLEGAKGEG